jgi:hypothetical protein
MQQMAAGVSNGPCRLNLSLTHRVTITMRNLRVNKRGDDLAMYGVVVRVSKGVYEITIRFTQSRRKLDWQRVTAPTAAAAKQWFILEYPTLTWGAPKPPKPPKIKKERTYAIHAIKPRTKKVLRKRKKPVRRKVSNPVPTTRRRNPKAGAEL